MQEVAFQPQRRRWFLRNPDILSPLHVRIICVTWICILLLLAADIFWLYIAAIKIAPATLYVAASAFVGLSVIAYIYRHLRPDEGIWLMATIACQLIMGTLALAFLSYLSLRWGYPLQSTRFAAMDKLLGFDWLACIGWMERQPVLARIFTFSYGVTEPEVLLILALLFLRGRYVQMHRFTVQFLAGAFVTIIIAAFVPAPTVYEYYQVDPTAYPHLQITSALAYLGDFYGMYNRTLTVLPRDLQGLVAFPSFHSTIAVMAIYAAFKLPFLPLRLFIIALNVLMLLSTPVDGGHYIIDTIGGALIGIALIGWTARLLPEKTVVN